MLPREILKAKRTEVLRIAEKYDVRNLRIFGSIARGEDDEKSDIDLLVELPPKFTLLKYAALIRELEEELSCKVDMVSQTAVKPRMKQSVFNEAVPL
ncbi:MAG: nucleotidyltransferase family protein [FCB group bacterium]|nr:nucleotidyltransferase family protein [FCB group bacterium]